MARSLDDAQRYDVVIVDEAQDLTPVGLSVCIELCKDPAGLYLTADASQSIYSRGFSWQRVHDDLRVRGRTTVLKRNYRMTRQIGAAAVQLLREHGGGDEEVLENNAVHWGPKPVLLGYESVDEEARAIAEVPAQHLRSTEVTLDMDRVRVMTVHAAKGLEFPFVAELDKSLWSPGPNPYVSP